MPWSGMLDGVAEKYNGNLKTLLLCLGQSPQDSIPRTKTTSSFKTRQDNQKVFSHVASNSHQNFTVGS